jgi:hypothetical protein
VRDDGSELAIHAMKMRPKYRQAVTGRLTMAKKKTYGRSASGKRYANTSKSANRSRELHCVDSCPWPY